MRPDIYDGEQVDKLKADYDELLERFKAVVHENTELSKRLDRIRRRRDDDEWMNEMM